MASPRTSGSPLCEPSSNFMILAKSSETVNTMPGSGGVASLMPHAGLRADENPRLPPQIKRPLSLLELPIDILTEVINHLPHANDLTALALSHSVLHSLAIPYIYSRFDIVWPDQGMQSDSRAGVDALTYGLATLVKGQELFGQAASRHSNAGFPRLDSNSFQHLYPIRRRRFGNDYAHHTRKFSLGNGPADCVREYLITKEGGKMLGTLVALAVARMKNLESFVWDMPTGILRDVWLALSALDDDGGPEPHKLERLWIRWHNNGQLEHAEAPPPPPPPNVPPSVLGQSPRSQMQSGNVSLHGTSTTLPPLERVEHPSLSIVPALKSLTVLEVDELVYLDEMAILVARSAHMLRELRLGIARHTRDMVWTKNWEGREYHQVDHSTTWTVSSKIGDKRLQGVLGVLIGRMHNLKNNAERVRACRGINHLAEMQRQMQHDSSVTRPVGSESGAISNHVGHVWSAPTASNPTAGPNDFETDETLNSRVANISLELHPIPSSPPVSFQLDKLTPLRPAKQLPNDSKSAGHFGPYLNGILSLNILELEGVHLSIPVLRNAFDFTSITSLTLMNCQNHEKLWRDLRHRYSTKVQRRSNKNSLQLTGPLSLRRIHTDTPSISFLRFIREALQPNTLEALFLQARWGVPVSISAIFDTAVMRHRSSLQQLLIDSSQLEEPFTEPSNRWRKWRLTRKMVACITSGRFPRLRELAVSIDYADWHIFLQRLFRVRTLRSLYIPHIADHPHGSNLDTHDQALQIVDIITLRPEIELCYMGLGQKCFEILETKRTRSGSRDSMSSAGTSQSSRNTSHAQDADDLGDATSASEIGGDEDGDGDAHASADESEGNGWSTAEEDGGQDIENLRRFVQDDETSGSDDEEIEDLDSHGDGDSISDSGGHVKTRSTTSLANRLRLQEILFYDKIAIFKVRHGKL